MIRLMIVVAMLSVSVPAMAVAGPCDHSWQTAKDGSQCGDRAADQREGGRTGYE